MSKKLAFVIEDDYDGSMVFSKALEANGMKAEQIMDGSKALERLAAMVPALVVLDLHLPNVPGPEILRHIRADARLAETLVVVVTADPRQAEMIRDEADLVLLKPTTFSQVRDLVGRLQAVRARARHAEEAPSEAPAAAPEAESLAAPEVTPSAIPEATPSETLEVTPPAAAEMEPSEDPEATPSAPKTKPSAAPAAKSPAPSTSASI